MYSTNNTIAPDRLKEKENKLVISYKTLRNLIGYTAMIFPVVLVFTSGAAHFNINIEPSFSDYYYTASGDILVSFLCILGALLFIYKGYNKKENVLTTIAGICGIFAAFSPTAADHLGHSFNVHTPLSDVPVIFGIERHTILAGLFFIVLGFISLACFPQTDVNNQNKQITTLKKKRNNIFKVCGWIMLICVAIMGFYFVSDKFSSMFGKIPFIFIMETVATWAFGISWLTIGGTIYPDGEHYLVSGYKAIKQFIRNSFINSEK